MNDLMMFEGHEVEVFELNGKAMFNPYHVGECLGMAPGTVKDHMSKMSAKQAILVKNSDVGLTNFRKLNNAGEKFLTESGVYKLVFKSRKPNAEAFTDWVTDEVLPQIRQTGGYIPCTPEDDEKTILAKAYLIAEKTIEEQSKKLAQQNNEIKNLTTENGILSKEQLQWADPAIINSIVRRYGNAILKNNPGSDPHECFGQAWVTFKKELLYKHGININSRKTYYLNEHGKAPKRVLDLLTQPELADALSTIVSMCKEGNLEYQDLLMKKAC